MDPLTHTLLTRKLISERPAILIAANAPDFPFYLSYPAWVVAQGKALHALKTNEWPDPPRWMQSSHYALHSVPVALVVAVIARVVQGRWPGKLLGAWSLHILVDVPTHSKAKWGPRFLWPFSDFAVDGLSWAEIAFRVLRPLIEVVDAAV